MNFNLTLPRVLGLCLWVTLGACDDTSIGTDGGPAADTGSTAPALVETTTVVLTAGPAWDPALPPEMQDLAGHFEYMGALFAEGRLLAFGPLGDGRGFYVYDSSAVPVIDDIFASDPGMTNDVLQVDEQGTWWLQLDQLGSSSAEPVFILDYGPGAGWVPGSPLGDQPIDEHVTYVGGLFADGTLIAGGPVSDMGGRYAVHAADEAAALALVAADPTTGAGGVFEVAVVSWTVLQRQSVHEARE